MRVIHKYPMDPDVVQCIISTPDGAVVRHVALQGEIKCLWADHDPKWEHVQHMRTFYYVGTGHAEIGDKDIYLGTVHQTYSGGRVGVWHVFERIH